MSVKESVLWYGAIDHDIRVIDFNFDLAYIIYLASMKNVLLLVSAIKFLWPTLNVNGKEGRGIKLIQKKNNRPETALSLFTSRQSY